MRALRTNFIKSSSIRCSTRRPVSKVARPTSSKGPSATMTLTQVFPALRANNNRWLLSKPLTRIRKWSNFHRTKVYAKRRRPSNRRRRSRPKIIRKRIRIRIRGVKRRLRVWLPRWKTCKSSSRTRSRFDREIYQSIKLYFWCLVLHIAHGDVISINHLLTLIAYCNLANKYINYSSLLSLLNTIIN